MFLYCFNSVVDIQPTWPAGGTLNSRKNISNHCCNMKSIHVLLESAKPVQGPPCLRRKSLTPRLVNPCHKKKHRILKRIDKDSGRTTWPSKGVEIFESALSGS